MSAKAFVFFITTAWLLACSIAPRVGKNRTVIDVPDGVYEGSYSSFPNFAEVRVTIHKNRIARVELLRHVASERGIKAGVVIPKRIVEEQSTDVDALTGATNSSRVIMHATQNAIVDNR